MEAHLNPYGLLGLPTQNMQGFVYDVHSGALREAS
jgi:hypothetical protein